MVEALSGCSTLGEVAETLRSWETQRHEQPEPFAAAHAALNALGNGRIPDDIPEALREMESACELLRV